MNQEITNNPFNRWCLEFDDEIKVSLASLREFFHGLMEKLKSLRQLTTGLLNQNEMVCSALESLVQPNYECLCGKYKRMKYRGVVCEKCGVKLLYKSSARRMGHIELASPVAHIWFLKSFHHAWTNTNMTLRDLERVLYFNYVVIEPGLTDLSYGQMLSEEEFMDAQDTYGIDAFTANIGARAIMKMLAVIDLEAEADRLKKLKKLREN